MLAVRRERGKDVPVVLCDQCGEEITTAADGNYQWWVPEDNKEGDVHSLSFTHKHCSRTFGQTHRGRSVGTWYAMELQVLPVYLGNNLKVDWTKARKLARLMGEL